MIRTVVSALIGILCCATNGRADTQIEVGHHLLLPNTPNQRIDIFVTGTSDDLIQGANVLAQIGANPETAAGVPVFQYLLGEHPAFPGPNLSTVLGPGSIFSSALSSETGYTAYPTALALSARTSNVPVPDGGLLVSLYVDTTGVFVGHWPLMMANTYYGTTDWGGSIVLPRTNPLVYVPNPIVTNGTITIIPEPSAILLSAFAVVALYAIAFRHRVKR